MSPSSWSDLAKLQQQQRESSRHQQTPQKALKPQAPAAIILRHGTREMKRWELPTKKPRPGPAHAAHAAARDDRGIGSYFSADSVSSVGSGMLRCAPADMLLAPPVRGARDAAYAAAIAAGHPPEIAAAAAAVAVKAIILKKPLNVALLMAASTAQCLADGYEPRIASAAGVRAGELFGNGFSAGAALAGGEAYAEAMLQGYGPTACDAASMAAAAATDAAGEADPDVMAALARGEIPDHVRAQAVAAGAAAAAAIKAGASAFGASIAGKAAAKAIADGYSEDAAAAAGAAAATAVMAGHGEEAALVAGEAAARTIMAGGTWEEAMLAGAVAADAFAAGMGLAEALAKGARVAAGVEKFELSVVDANGTALDSIPVGIDDSAAIHGGDSAEVEAEVQAYLDLQFQSNKVGGLYNDPSLRGKQGEAKRPGMLKLSSTKAAADGEGEGVGGGAAIGLEAAAAEAMMHAIHLEETRAKGGKWPPADFDEGGNDGGCMLM